MILFRALSRFRALFDGDGPSAQNRDTTVLYSLNGYWGIEKYPHLLNLYWLIAHHVIAGFSIRYFGKFRFLWRRRILLGLRINSEPSSNVAQSHCYICKINNRLEKKHFSPEIAIQILHPFLSSTTQKLSTYSPSLSPIAEVRHLK